MNPEFKSVVEVPPQETPKPKESLEEVPEKTEEEINEEIAALRQEFPKLDKAEYWEALQEAMLAQEKLLKLLRPLFKNTDAGRSLQIPEQRAAINADLEKMMLLRQRNIAPTPASMEKEFQISISKKEIDSLFEVQTARQNLKNQLSLANDSFDVFAERIKANLDRAYYLVPEKPTSGAMNKYFKAETHGIPKILKGALVFSAADWNRLFPEIVQRGNLNEEDGTGKNYSGFSVRRDAFLDDDLLSRLGLVVLEEQPAKGKNEEAQSSTINYELESLARHEAVHQIDFLRTKRRGLDSLLSEMIAYRIDAKLGASSAVKSGTDSFSVFVNESLDDYARSLGVDAKRARELVTAALAAIDRLKKNKYTYVEITASLLNCESFAELFELAKKSERK